MAYSEIEIVNLALSNLGIGNPIASFDEDSQEARVAALWYDHCRDSVLEDFPWSFAQKWATLALVEEDPNDDWSFSYRFPTDCLRPRAIVTGQFGSTTTTPTFWPIPPWNWSDPLAARVPFTTGNDDQGKLIYTDMDTAVMLYTVRYEDPSFFAPSFANALAWKLSSQMAAPLTIALPLKQAAEQAYYLALTRAAANDQNGQEPRPLPESSFIRARM